ncbi:type VI secretion system baseplate subunit TssE [Schlesneria paludicola]|uniref:type VI secretion system baseplate subunit TssE n=1 Tax=Schlesneria paludicola TaxID=360056 RepID=UPI000299EE09|nr:type VI secretion system baseplate subunit TssE [Schlesneria paludicola]
MKSVFRKVIREMPPVNPQQPLLPSLLDRLIDEDPERTSDPLWRGSYRLEELREHVRRDLEFLLNTRHGRYDLLNQPCELSVSSLSYGLPDFTGVIGGGMEYNERVRLTVERAIRDFEPRLRNVRVEVRKPEFEYDRNMHLTIHAMLSVDPILEHVTFDTTVEASSGTCEVRPS